jgi:hypothetical protein
MALDRSKGVVGGARVAKDFSEEFLRLLWLLCGPAPRRYLNFLRIIKKMAAREAWRCGIGARVKTLTFNLKNNNKRSVLSTCFIVFFNFDICRYKQ